MMMRCLKRKKNRDKETVKNNKNINRMKNCSTRLCGPTKF